MTDTYAGIPVNPKPMTLTDWVKTKEGQAESARICNEALEHMADQRRQMQGLNRLWGWPIEKEWQIRYKGYTP